jgi:hypothetical protein
VYYVWRRTRRTVEDGFGAQNRETNNQSTIYDRVEKYVREMSFMGTHTNFYIYIRAIKDGWLMSGGFIGRGGRDGIVESWS